MPFSHLFSCTLIAHVTFDWLLTRRWWKLFFLAICEFLITLPAAAFRTDSVQNKVVATTDDKSRTGRIEEHLECTPCRSSSLIIDFQFTPIDLPVIPPFSPAYFLPSTNIFVDLVPPLHLKAYLLPLPPRIRYTQQPILITHIPTIIHDGNNCCEMLQSHDLRIVRCLRCLHCLHCLHYQRTQRSQRLRELERGRPGRPGLDSRPQIWVGMRPMKPDGVARHPSKPHGRSNRGKRRMSLREELVAYWGALDVKQETTYTSSNEDAVEWHGKEKRQGKRSPAANEMQSRSGHWI